MHFVLKKIQLHTIFLNCALLLLSACAQVVPLTGGVKDVSPPRIAKYVPDSASVNFNSKEIRIFFNEYIQLKELANQFIVSPYLKHTPEVNLLKGKVLRIKISDTLMPNTTYTMSFGNAIQDLNESNTLKNFRYVFSTGKSLDTISLAGKVQDAFDLKTEKDVWVMLYADLTDSAIYKLKPLYYTKANEDGTFRLYNIRKGSYKLIALKDENKNLLYNPVAEKMAFTNGFLNLTKSSTDKKLYLFIENSEKQLLKSRNIRSYGNFLLVFNKPVHQLKLNYIKGTKPDKEIFLYSANRDTLNYWFSEQQSDTVKVQISDNGRILDTLTVKTIPKEPKTEKGRTTKLKLSAYSALQSTGKLDVNSDIVVFFNHPIVKLDENKIVLEVNHKPYTEYKLIWDSIAYKLIIKTTHVDEEVKKVLWKEGADFKLTLLPKAATDIFNLENDSVKFTFKIRRVR